MSSRRKARTLALQLLYQIDLRRSDPEEIDAIVAAWPFEPQPAPPEREMALRLVHGTVQHRDEIDQHLAALAEHWSLERMLAVDRNLLRLAGYEILYTDTPVPVAINEALEIAKLFGDEKSPAFINGLLDGLARRVRKSRS